MNRNMIDYLPPVLQSIREFKALVDAEQPEVSDLWVALENALNDQFIEDATENGVARLEKIISITPNPTSSLQERKLTILAKMNERLPYTFRILKERLDSICGTDGYTMTLSNDTYTLTIRVQLSGKTAFPVVNQMVSQVVPANMLIDISLEYNKHQAFSGLTHAQLSAYTHANLREEVIL